jgi:hypothetical protein
LLRYWSGSVAATSDHTVAPPREAPLHWMQSFAAVTGRTGPPASGATRSRLHRPEVCGAVIALKVTESADTTGSARYPGSATQVRVRDVSRARSATTRHDLRLGSEVLYANVPSYAPSSGSAMRGRPSTVARSWRAPDLRSYR